MLDYDSALGEAGLAAQPGLALALLSLLPAATLPGMWSVLFVFSGHVPPHRCRVADCDTEDSQYSEPWVNTTTAGSCSLYTRTPIRYS